MSRLPIFVPAVIALAVAQGCTPNNATMVSGSYTAFLAASTSTSVLNDELDVTKFDNSSEVDCRIFESEDEEIALRLPNSVLTADDCLALYDLGTSTFSGDPTLQEGWLVQDGYYIVGEDFKPWRGEALVTTEGDLQLGFHQDLPSGEDFRFLFVVDPDFQPTRCEVDAAGKTAPVNLDGDWLGEWSASVEAVLAAHPDEPSYAALKNYPGGTVYFINAFSYQWNPDDPNTFDNPFWTMPDEWGAGTGNGKFSQEFFSNRTVRFAEPILYSSYEATEDQTDPVVSPENIWYCDQDPAAPGACLNATTSKYVWGSKDEMDARVDAVADEVRDELAALGVNLRPLVETNAWRAVDGNPPGLDGWTELHYNWVVLDKSSVVEKGGSVKGAFNFVMDGSTSTSRFFLNGEFEVDRIKGDIWSNQDLQELKAQQAADAGQPLCENFNLED